MEMEEEKQLAEICRKFIKDQKISCSESVYQSDNVILNACELIEQICEIVGYFEYPEG
jgi:hypothetical protein